MRKAYVFPGQGAQFPGMGKDLYEQSDVARQMFQRANGTLGFDIAEIMFNGGVEDLTRTSVTQPAIYIHSVILAYLLKIQKNAAMVAGHSLGEFSALAAAGGYDFEDGLKLVAKRAQSMQTACDARPSTMAAIIGLTEKQVEEICAQIDSIVVPANYNAPDQIVISGTLEGVTAAIELAKQYGAKMAKPLQVNGAFHSPLMETARIELAQAILSTEFIPPVCPIYQNYTGLPETNAQRIQENLYQQLIAPVLWSQSVQNMIKDGATEFEEIGPGKTLSGLVKRINDSVKITTRNTLE